MGKLIPRIDIEQIENDGERKIASLLLKQLPERVRVYHSIEFIDRKKLGECDFVVLHPDYGLLFVEVKGGEIGFNETTSRWERRVRDERRVITNPFEQVRKNMFSLLEKIHKEFALKDTRNAETPYFDFTNGFAVAFPDCIFSGKLPPYAAIDIIIYLKKCKNLLMAIDTAFKYYPKNAKLTENDTNRIHIALAGQFNLFPILWNQVAGWESKVKRCTENQKKMIEAFEEIPCAAIKGIAGSGKTILALSKAQSLARKGYKTLLICYNYYLYLWFINNTAKEYQEFLEIYTYHQLVEKFCKKANLHFPSLSENPPIEFWDETAPELLMNSAEILGQADKYEALVVDEGQDFHALWWISLESIFKDFSQKKSYYVFYDPHQNIKRTNHVIPEYLLNYPMPLNCRNTISIAKYCEKIIGEQIISMSDAPEGDEPLIFHVKSIEESCKQIEKQIRIWCDSERGGLKYQQVVVLTPYGSFIPDLKISSKFYTTEYEKWNKENKVFITTIGKFKGLESDAIIVVHNETGDGSLTPSKKYVAYSRAKYLLSIINIST
ncbi:MAG: NERD domain-containing protein [Rhizobiales bacterium]|nr:NERD domain-containing protein [Hyphomicrobiales bacterium]